LESMRQVPADELYEAAPADFDKLSDGQLWVHTIHELVAEFIGGSEYAKRDAITSLSEIISKSTGARAVALNLLREQGVLVRLAYEYDVRGKTGLVNRVTFELDNAAAAPPEEGARTSAPPIEVGAAAPPGDPGHLLCSSPPGPTPARGTAVNDVRRGVASHRPAGGPPPAQLSSLSGAGSAQ